MNPAPPDQAQARKAAERIVAAADRMSFLMEPFARKIAKASLAEAMGNEYGIIKMARVLLSSPVPAQEDGAYQSADGLWADVAELAKHSRWLWSKLFSSEHIRSSDDVERIAKAVEDIDDSIRTGNPATIRAALAKLKEGRSDE